MAITKLKSGSVAEAFTAEAPDAKAAPKLRAGGSRSRSRCRRN